MISGLCAVKRVRMAVIKMNEETILSKLEHKVTMMKIQIIDMEKMLEEIYTLKNLTEILNEIAQYIPKGTESE